MFGIVLVLMWNEFDSSMWMLYTVVLSITGCVLRSTKGAPLQTLLLNHARKVCPMYRISHFTRTSIHVNKACFYHPANDYYISNELEDWRGGGGGGHSMLIWIVYVVVSAHILSLLVGGRGGGGGITSSPICLSDEIELSKHTFP